VLIGATTQNPFFEVNKALISRSTVFPLYPLTTEEIVRILKQAAFDTARGLGEYKISIEDDVLRYIADICNGDARIALNAIELAVMTTAPELDGSIRITVEMVEDCMQKRSISFDADGESHYDTISAFIKSMRGSDPDATVFYLARALHGGEDIEFLARRIIICASEDVGMANPSALNTAVSAYNAIMLIGMPEARIILAHAAISVATSPKSNASYMAIDKALQDVANKRTGEIPMHLRNAPVKGMKDLGYSVGYKYVHDYPDNYVEEEYLPEEIKGTEYYNPYANGYEQKIKEWLDAKRAKKSKKTEEKQKQ
jgi:putative ATPase